MYRRWRIADHRGAAADPDTVAELVASLDHTWDLYEQQYGWTGVDGRGTPVDVLVHRTHRHPNASWGGHQLIAGDGDREIFGPFTGLTVVAHEYSHGVIEHTARLAGDNQPGAVGEHIADVFAALTDQYARRQRADEASWLIGEGVFRPGVRGRALRSMIAPGTAFADPIAGVDPQAASMADYYRGDGDDGGIHINSGILNRAFAIAARAAGGWAWEGVGQVWWHALTSGRINPRPTFTDWATATVDAAAELNVDHHIRDAWTTVGVSQVRSAI